jgi:hypothetical protein
MVLANDLSEWIGSFGLFVEFARGLIALRHFQLLQLAAAGNVSVHSMEFPAMFPSKRFNQTKASSQSTRPSSCFTLFHATPSQNSHRHFDFSSKLQ